MNTPQSWRTVKQALLLTFVLALGVAGLALAAPGELDPQFDGDGKVSLDFGSRYEGVHALALRASQKILVGGFAQRNGANDFALASYTGSGSLDASFGDGGKVLTDFYGNADEIYALAVQSDGKIIAGGEAHQTNEPDFALARYLPDGSLDTSFDGDGKALTDFDDGADTIHALALQTDGKIIAAGETTSSGELDFALARYLPNGSLDASFGDAGKVVITLSFEADGARGVAIQPDGKIVAAGLVKSGGQSDFGLARFNADGSPDASFGVGGLVITDFGASDEAYGLAVQLDGKIVVVGETRNAVDSSVALARYQSDGSPDTSFDEDGKTTSGYSGDTGAALALQLDGKIIVAGTVEDEETYDFVLMRFNPDGSLDAGFGSGGRAITDFGGSDDVGSAVGLQRDGKIVVAGSASTSGDEFAVLARYTTVIEDSVSLTQGESGTAGDTKVTLRLNAEGSCTFTVAKYLAPPGGLPPDPGEMPIMWSIAANCNLSGALDVDLTLCYTDSEFANGNKVNENNLTMFRKGSGSGWIREDVTAHDTAANCLTKTHVSALSYWTLGDPEQLANGTPTAVEVQSFTARAVQPTMLFGAAGGAALWLAVEIVRRYRRRSAIR